ncbi:hypothetical protein HNQ94_003859 [Salirhabdus euzebyi]|uniref:Uncharacterized protein n=1 Tax=Salirhabdus euzebyi TaxID=394506 RepID=A0A841Q9J5_9BACI|nr:hypothetical protein [Salirhabdus euzebyi]MBB6455359.1 hypothetical protein [Salirhabdus euzebyi]
MRNRNWLPIVASVGIGAAAYYSMRNGQGMGKMVQKFAPFVAGMNGATQGQQQNNTLQSSNMQ